MRIAAVRQVHQPLIFLLMVTNFDCKPLTADTHSALAQFTKLALSQHPLKFRGAGLNRFWQV